MPKPITVPMTGNRRVEFANTTALVDFAASRAVQLEALMLALADDGLVGFEMMSFDARDNLFGLVQGITTELRELTCAMGAALLQVEVRRV